MSLRAFDRRGGISTPFAIMLLLVALSIALANVAFVDYGAKRSLREAMRERVFMSPDVIVEIPPPPKAKVREEPLRLVNFSPYDIHLIALWVNDGKVNERHVLDVWLKPSEVYEYGKAISSHIDGKVKCTLILYTAMGPVTYTSTIREGEMAQYKLKFVTERGNLFFSMIVFLGRPEK